jgi:hypothetical protein
MHRSYYTGTHTSVSSGFMHKVSVSACVSGRVVIPLSPTLYVHFQNLRAQMESSLWRIFNEYDVDDDVGHGFFRKQS